jgi:hypothetical protein
LAKIILFFKMLKLNKIKVPSCWKLKNILFIDFKIS